MMVYGSQAEDAELVVLYGNCQITYLAMLLASADNNERTYLCLLNHAYPGTELMLPTAAQLARCVLYLEQFDSEDAMPVREAIRQHLPAGCPTLIFPTFMMFCLWPFIADEPRARSQPGFPWGVFPYGDRLALTLLAEGLSGEAARQAYDARLVAILPELPARLAVDIERIQRHDRASDVTIGDYVLANFRQHHLFWTTGHVSRAAIGELANRIYTAVHTRLGQDLATGLQRIEQRSADWAGMGEQQLPIHPAVAQALGLSFVTEGMTFQWHSANWDFAQYLAHYLAHDLQLPAAPALSHDDILDIDLQLRTARAMRWLPLAIEVTAEHLTVEGWALPGLDAAESLRFLVNGADMTALDWPLASPDMLRPFGAIAGAEASRFRARYRHAGSPTLFPDGYLRLNVTGRFGEHCRSYRTAWYLAATDQALAPAREHHIANAPGSPALLLALGTATTVQRLEQFLREFQDQGLSHLSPVLELGCADDSITRHLVQLGASVTSVNLAPATPPEPAPPLDVADNHFALSLCLAAAGHWSVEDETRYLDTLYRVTRPGGLVLIGLPGAVQAKLLGTPSAQWQTLQRTGVLQDAQASATGYIWRSHEHVRVRWGAQFEVLDIIEGLASHLDLVVMRKPLG